MNVYYEEKFLERREQERNDRITEALRGSMRPPDAAIIQKLKEEKYGKPDGALRILRNGNERSGRDTSGSQQADSGKVRLRRRKNRKKKECMKERLDSLIGAGCEDAGFSPVERAVHDAIETIGFMAIEGQFQQASFKVDGTTISIKAGEKTKVTRKYTYEQSEEVQ